MAGWIAVLAGALATSSSSAAVLAPTVAQISAAAAEGTAMARRGEGYPLKDHLLYSVPDARDARPRDGDVDAIVIATPLERTRHAAFLAGYGGQALSPAEARERANLPNGSIEVIVFAHGADRSDQQFTQRFGAARLADGARALAVSSPDAGEAHEAIYPRAEQDRSRYVALIAYRFDLSALRDSQNARLRVSFRDPTGKEFDLPLDLGAYQ